MALDDLMRKLINDVDSCGKRTRFLVLDSGLHMGKPMLLIADLSYWDSNCVSLMLEAGHRGVEVNGLVLTFKSEQDRTFWLMKHG
jgi:hypothetical protein